MANFSFWPLNSEFSFWKAHKAGTIEKVPIDRMAIQQSHLGTLLEGARDAGNLVEQNQWVKNVDRLKGAEKDSRSTYSDAKRDYDYEVKFKVEDTPPGGCRYINQNIYYLLMFLLWLGELPLNSIVLRVLNQPEIFNWIVASALGLALLMCAHFIAKPLKKYVRTPIDKKAIVILLVIVGIILVAMALVREVYLKDKTHADTVITIGLIAVQCLIFWGALIAAYACEIPASREKMQASRDRYIENWTQRRKIFRACFWEVRKIRNAMDRVKDQFISTNLKKQSNQQLAPIAFYIMDFDDEEILNTPGTLRELEKTVDSNNINGGQ